MIAVWEIIFYKRDLILDKKGVLIHVYTKMLTLVHISPWIHFVWSVNDTSSRLNFNIGWHIRLIYLIRFEYFFWQYDAVGVIFFNLLTFNWLIITLVPVGYCWWKLLYKVVHVMYNIFLHSTCLNVVES